MLQKPTAGVDVDFDDWSILGTEAIVVGKLTQTGDNAYSLQFQLFDVFGKKAGQIPPPPEPWNRRWSLYQYSVFQYR
jgi:Tol biopolymer transport system component